MRKIYTFFTALLFFVLVAAPVISQTTVPPSSDRMDWWRNARFGMFIHWGLYAVPAGEWKGEAGYGEWIRTSAEIPLDVYDHFREQFNPVGFNADEWVKMARDAGMKYIVITSKHHDGFCMFNTAQTDFSIMNTPFHHDPMKDLAEACRKYGLKFCFYYSIMDWHHPDYLPRRAWEKSRPVAGAEYSRYVTYMKAELKELLTNYGDIGVLWFDGEWESTWNETFGKEIYAYCRSLQPGIIINNRVGAGRMDMEGLTKAGTFGGDFGTPEQQIPATGLPGVDWETCMTMNDHWGYNRSDKNFKSAKDLIRMLVDVASKGGNYLLNVGPTAEGVIPPESAARLKTIGGWMQNNGESVWGTNASPFASLSWGRCTRKEIPGGVRLYLHVFDRPKDSKLVLPGILNKPIRSWLVEDPDRSPLVVTRVDDALFISLPSPSKDSMDEVIAIDLEGRLDLTLPPQIVCDFDAFVDSLKVEMTSERGNVEIHYTLDGSDCDSRSALYKRPFYIRNPVLIHARCFRNGKGVSGVNTRSILKVEAALPVAVDNPVPGLNYSYYEGTWDSIPEFGRLKSLKTGTVLNFTLEPALAKEFYGFSFNGFIRIPADDMYAFYTESDDGSSLWIDGRKVVDNDGLHGNSEAMAAVALKKGFHAIRADYFNRSGSYGLVVSVRSTVLKKQVIPGSMLVH